MNTLIAVAIAPCGTGDEFAPYVAEIVRIIRESGLPNRTNSCSPKSKANGTMSWQSSKKRRNT